MNEAVLIYNNKDRTQWYTPLAVFHAIELFDRYLTWALDPRANRVPLRSEASSEAGQLHTRDETRIRFYVCIYIMHKYQATIQQPLPWERIFPGDLTVFARRAETERKAEAFEAHLIRDILKYRIFNDTFLECAGRYNQELGKNAIYQLLTAYAKCTETKAYSGTMEDLYCSVAKLEPRRYTGRVFQSRAESVGIKTQDYTESAILGRAESAGIKTQDYTESVVQGRAESAGIKAHAYIGSALDGVLARPACSIGLKVDLRREIGPAPQPC